MMDAVTPRQVGGVSVINGDIGIRLGTVEYCDNRYTAWAITRYS